MAQPRKGPPILASTERIEGPRVGRVVAFADGEVRVELDGHRGGPLVARVSAALDDAALAEAAREHREGVLLFEGGDSTRPVLLALLRSSTPLIDAVLAVPPSAAHRTARVDGRRVEIEGKEEVVLRCGKASLVLRRDGRVVLRGVDVISQGDRVQKVRGGKVQIN